MASEGDDTLVMTFDPSQRLKQALGVEEAVLGTEAEVEAATPGHLSASLLELGLYWRAQGQYWTTWARAAGGYASFRTTPDNVARLHMMAITEAAELSC